MTTKQRTTATGKLDYKLLTPMGYHRCNTCDTMAQCRKHRRRL